eukprot:Tbor_TRINITY_DN5373_c1_g6::TRINITY_DN5373_c1_g6_i1::g.5069::m.5069
MVDVRHIGCGSGAGLAAVCFTYPLDVLRVQNQVQIDMSAFKNNDRYRGITAAMTREVFYSGSRFTIYPYLKKECGCNKIVSGAIAGAVATSISHPFDLVKVVKICTPLKVRCSRIFINLLRNRQMYRAIIPALQKSVIFSAVQLSSFDYCKEALENFELNRLILIPLAAWMAGIASTFVSAPVDFAKTKIMAGISPNILAIARSVVQKDGLRGFWRGGFLTWLRLGPYTFVQMTTWEYLNEHTRSIS